MRLSFELDTRQATKALSALAGNLEDLRKPLEQSGNDLLQFFGYEVFETQGAVNGSAWRRLAASTLKMRQNRWGYYKQAPRRTDRILIWTGRLQDGFRKQVGKDILVIRNDVEYFKYHQLGQRRMLALNDRVISKVIARFNEHIANSLKKSI